MVRSSVPFRERLYTAECEHPAYDSESTEVIRYIALDYWLSGSWRSPKSRAGARR
jgi:hypothetical protein